MTTWRSAYVIAVANVVLATSAVLIFLVLTDSVPSVAVMPLVLPRPGGWSGFLPGRLFGPSGSKSGGDEDAAEFGEHVGGGGVGLGAVPGSAGAVFGDV